MLEPGCRLGSADLVEAGIRAGGEQAQVVGDANHLERQRPQRAGDIGHRSAGLHGIAEIVGGMQLELCDAGQLRDGLGAVVGMGVEAGADGRASEAERMQRDGVAADRRRGFFYGDSVGGELLPEGDGHGVLHVGASGLEDVFELLRLFRKA